MNNLVVKQEIEMKKIIVTTTINNPTQAIKLFDNIEGWHLIVIGDKKTPADYKLQNGKYYSPLEQQNKFPEFSDLLGWNCIQRRNIGFLYALELGADIIATVDDDNIPLDNWGQDILIDKKLDITSYENTGGFVFDPISVTNHSNLWHRGFPLQLVNQRNNIIANEKSPVRPKIQAGFWNGDPDVDAVCRMIYAPTCDFEPKYFPFTSKQITPFNSQNTFISRDLLSDYYMFTGVGRMDDIWGSYYLQAKTNERPIFTRPTVNQERNAHDLTKDFSGEVIGYQKTKNLINDLISNPEKIVEYLDEKSYLAFKTYQKIAQRY